MSYAAQVDIVADRYTPCVRTIVFRGLDLTGVSLRMQCRQTGDTPGAPWFDLQNVDNSQAQGLKLVSVSVVDSYPVSTLQIRINETTVEGLPYTGELGDATTLSYDLQGTFGGDKRVLVAGKFIIASGVTGAENAPANRPFGTANYQSHATGMRNGATLTFGETRIEITIDGVDLVTLQVDRAVAAQNRSEAAQRLADISAAAAQATGRYFASRSAGEAASTTDQAFATDDGAGSIIYYRKTASGSVEIARAVTPASLLTGDAADKLGYAITPDYVRRTVAAKLRERPSITDFGAVPDYNPQSGAGTDSLAAINKAIEYVAQIGGGEIYIPPVGAYKISGPIVPRGRVSLVSAATVIGAPGALYATGSKLFTFTDTINFNLRDVAFIGTRSTDIAVRENGLWSYGKVSGCYFANFRSWDQVLLGMHATGNTFQNLSKVHHGGSDCEFTRNYIQYDTEGKYLGASDVFWQWEAVQASSFAHNYVTCLGQADIDPTVFDLNLSNRVRVLNNQFDGGRDHTMRISSATHSCDFDMNRLSSQSSGSASLADGYVPFVIRENLMDVQIDRTWVQGLQAGRPFFKSIGGMRRVVISNTKFGSDYNDNSLHDIHSSADTGRIQIVGPAHPASYNIPNGATLRSWHFNRLITNAGQSVATQINGIDLSQLMAGDIIVFRVADDTKRWIITDASVGNIYDSQRDTGKKSFRIICVENGKPILDY